ncbi:hypothetical protein ANN_23370 [Periplaneta americana]|uniref:Uncharacterized protein n=1 Tax=Periplaneta americana TaxID=6978 RepID=A0ABQ8SKX0_PERAM|nr:hypothetical protein ANN_23370 [Periplaneta americana]
MAGLCEGGNEPPGSLKASKKYQVVFAVDVDGATCLRQSLTHRQKFSYKLSVDVPKHLVTRSTKPAAAWKEPRINHLGPFHTVMRVSVTPAHELIALSHDMPQRGLLDLAGCIKITLDLMGGEKRGEVHGIADSGSHRRIDIITFEPGERQVYILDQTIRFGTHQNQPEEHVWADEHPHAVEERRHQYRFSINVWIGILGDRLRAIRATTEINWGSLSGRIGCLAGVCHVSKDYRCGSCMMAHQHIFSAITESYPAFARIGLRENPGINLNQVTCPDRDSNPGHLVSRPDALTVTPQVWTPNLNPLDFWLSRTTRSISKKLDFAGMDDWFKAFSITVGRRKTRRRFYRGVVGYKV